MRYEKLTDLMHKMWVNGLERQSEPTTITLLGSPGIGKTSTTRTLADTMEASVRSNPALAKQIFKGRVPKDPKAICRVLDLSSMLPEDLNGLPFRDDKVTKFCAHEWLHEMCAPGAFGVLCLDDLPAAAPMMQVAARQISLERRVHDHYLSPGIFIVVTGNRREDKSAASTLPAHFRNSVLLLDVDIDVDEWAKWAGSQEHINQVIPAYLRFKREHLSMLPKDQDKRGAFATPRSWAKLASQFEVAESADALFEVASGLVGEGVATSFTAFVKIRNNLVDPEKVFDNPEKALPNPDTLGSPDKLVAMATALGEIAASRHKNGKGKAKSEAPLKLLRALAWTTRTSREYCGAGVSTYIAVGGQSVLPPLVKVARANRKDPVVGQLLSFLKSALLEGNG
jgi:hypothetical protein